MRLYLKLTKNTEVIPFNYQPFLTGAIHKWLGVNNQQHGSLSLFSFSWLQHVHIKNNNGVDLKKDAYFFISAYDEHLIKKILGGVLQDPDVCCGSRVYDVQIIEEVKFSTSERFLTASPVLVKRTFENVDKHFTYEDPNVSEYLTETLQRKLDKAGLPTGGVSVKFDLEYPAPQTKIIRYKGIGNRVNICPVIIEGSSEQVAFAWNVGIGNSTGVGFGALK